MKFEFFFIAVLAVFFVSCESDDNDSWVSPTVTEGAYILNSGTWNTNNSKLSYYDFGTGELTADVFENINQKGMGNTANDMVIYGSKMYVAVTTSNVVYALDKKGRILAEIRSAEIQNDQPRYLAVAGGKIYITTYSGYVLKIDTTSYAIEARAKVGSFPEDIVVSNNKLYVANSGQGSGTTVSVIDINNFEAGATDIKGFNNPCLLVVDNQGNVYVNNWNGNTISKIDISSNNVSLIESAKASGMIFFENKIYMFCTNYDNYPELDVEYSWYDVTTGSLHKENFVPKSNYPGLANTNSISIDPVSKDFYISTSDFNNNGDMYIFKQDGTFVKKFDTGGINPIGAFFVFK